MNYIITVKDYKRYTYESLGPVSESQIKSVIDQYCIKYYQKAFTSVYTYTHGTRSYSIMVTLSTIGDMTIATKTMNITEPGLFYGSRTDEKSEIVCKFRTYSLERPEPSPPQSQSQSQSQLQPLDVQSFEITPSPIKVHIPIPVKPAPTPNELLGAKIHDNYEQELTIYPTIYLPPRKSARETLPEQVANFDRRKLRKAPIRPPHETFNIRHKAMPNAHSF